MLVFRGKVSCPISLRSGTLQIGIRAKICFHCGVSRPLGLMGLLLSTHHLWELLVAETNGRGHGHWTCSSEVGKGVSQA
jgi:hypothetical protein